MKMPSIKDRCYVCNQLIDGSDSQWTSVPTEPIQFVHIACLEGKQLNLGPILVAFGSVEHDRAPAKNIDTSAGTTQLQELKDRGVPVFDPGANPASDLTMFSPTHRFVLRCLLVGIKRRARFIYFERSFDSPPGQQRIEKISVICERDGVAEIMDEVLPSSHDGAPTEFWQKILINLATIAQLVDDRAEGATSGAFALRLSKNRFVEFSMTSNSNLLSADRVSLEVQSL